MLLASGCGGSDDKGAQQGDAAPAPTTSTTAAPATPADVVEGLNKALVEQDEQAFLAAFSDQTRPTAQQWWKNLDGLGMDLGGVEVREGEDLQYASSGVTKASGVIAVGVHTAYDADDDDDDPMLNEGRYTVTVEGGKITAWKPYKIVAPWDEGPLYIKRSGHVALAAPAADKAYVDRYFDEASEAAAWNIEKMKEFAPHSLYQKGFVAFVAKDQKTTNRWFRTGENTHGGSWADTQAGGYNFDQWATEPTKTYGKEIGGGSIAGSRIVVRVTGTDVQMERTFVHEFAHGLMSPFGYQEEERRQDAWVIEGFARWFETVWAARPDSGGTGKYADTDTGKWIRDAVSSGAFTGNPPTDAQIYESSATSAARGYALSSSVYAYINEEYGGSAAIESCTMSYYLGYSPFHHIVKKSRPGKDPILYPESQIKREWQAWVRNNYS